MSNYWQERAKSRLLKSEQIGLEAMNQILPIYEQSLRNINKEINSIYINYSKKVGLDVNELSQILSGVDKNNFLKNIQAKMKALGFKVSDVYDRNYIARLTRLEALKQQVYWEIQSIAPREVDISTNAYRRIVVESYTTSRGDIRRELGRAKSFATISDRSVKQMLIENWQGGNYSTRVWGNTGILARDLQVVIGAGLTAGTSQEKMATQIRERFDVGKYKSMRLVRTETNYFQNQAELQSYKDEGVKFYRYEAIMDGRTSDICSELDGKVFRIGDATEGENYPPMHPNCRSDTTIVFEEEAALERVYTKEDVNEIQDRQQELTDTQRFMREIYETQMQGLEEQGWKRR